MKGKIVLAVKDESGRMLEIYNKTSEEFLDQIFWDGGDCICEFEKVMVKSEGKIDFFAKIKTDDNT
jgi:hypothetical protein